MVDDAVREWMRANKKNARVIKHEAKEDIRAQAIWEKNQSKRGYKVSTYHNNHILSLSCISRILRLPTSLRQSTNDDDSGGRMRKSEWMNETQAKIECTSHRFQCASRTVASAVQIPSPFGISISFAHRIWIYMEMSVSLSLALPLSLLTCHPNGCNSSTK